MSLRFTRLFCSAITERYYTGTISAIMHGKGKIVCDADGDSIDPFALNKPVIKSPDCVHEEALREMFPEYAPCGKVPDTAPTIDFTESSLARGQNMRALRSGYRVRFDVVEVSSDAAADDTGSGFDDDSNAAVCKSESDMSTVAQGNLLRRRSLESSTKLQKKRKQYAVVNMMVIKSPEAVAAHRAFAKSRAELTDL